MINGKALPDGEMTQVLHHLDTICLGTNCMLLFKYPLQYRKQLDLKFQVREELKEEDTEEPDDDEVNHLVKVRL